MVFTVPLGMSALNPTLCLPQHRFICAVKLEHSACHVCQWVHGCSFCTALNNQAEQWLQMGFQYSAVRAPYALWMIRYALTCKQFPCGRYVCVVGGGGGGRWWRMWMCEYAMLFGRGSSQPAQSELVLSQTGKQLFQVFSKETRMAHGWTGLLWVWYLRLCCFLAQQFAFK